MAASLVASRQLPCDIVAAECSAKWKWLQKDINHGDGSSGCGGKMAAQPCNIITAAQSESDCQKKKK